MAKTPKPKKRETSIHSRAARRQSSPTAPSDSGAKSKADDAEQPWVYRAQNAGVSKRRKTKQLTRGQRLRQQKGMEHAERNIDKLEKKVKDSKQRGRKVRDRRAEWDDLNGTGHVDVVKEVGGDAQGGAARGNWMEKIVDVELKEAMGEIESFELPQQHIEAETKKSALESMFSNGGFKADEIPTNDAEDIDDIS